jgi:hypothetical protein
LEKAQQIAQIHLLLREETAEGHNGWYSQCEREGKTAIFIKDVSRAWQLAEEHFIENPTKSIGLQVRYALITTSLNSLATNIPPELIAALIKHEIWTPAQGLAYVRQNQDDEKQAEGLKAIIPYLTPDLLPEALEIARGIGDEYYRAEALTGLAPHLPEILPEALATAREIWYESDRAKALTGLAPYLPEILPEALKAIRGIDDEIERVVKLIELVPHFPDNLHETLEVIRAIEDKSIRARALTELALHFPKLLPEVLELLEALRAFGDYHTFAIALIKLTRHLPEILLPEASKALEAIRSIKHPYYRAKDLIYLAPYLSKNLLPEVLEAIEEIKFNGNEDDYIQALIRLSLYFTEILPEALEQAKCIGDNDKLADTYLTLALYLPEILLPEHLKAIKPELIEAIKEEAGYLLDLPPPKLLKIVREAKAKMEEKNRSKALRRLSPHLPEIFPEALEIAKEIGSEFKRAEALQALTATLTPANVDLSFWQDVLQALGSLTRPHFLETVPHLVPLILHFGGEVALREVYQGIRDVSQWWK